MLLAILLALFHPAQNTTTIAVNDTSVPYVYHTYVRGRFDSFGYGGQMRFRITNGFVNGTYRPDTGGGLAVVSGGTQGSRIWFDIATLGGLHINGTMEADGTIKGLGSSTSSSKQWVFTATPLPSPAP
jgi:hypothetical protein